jgi:hypothetical protein
MWFMAVICSTGCATFSLRNILAIAPGVGAVSAAIVDDLVES